MPIKNIPKIDLPKANKSPIYSLMILERSMMWLKAKSISACTCSVFYKLAKNKSTLQEPIEHSNNGLITFPRGIPNKNSKDKIIGAIGVNGSAVENDHAVAEGGALTF